MIVFSIPDPVYILPLSSSDVRTPEHLCLVPSTRHDDTCLQSRNLGGRSTTIRNSELSLANPKFKASIGYNETLSQVIVQ